MKTAGWGRLLHAGWGACVLAFFSAWGGAQAHNHSPAKILIVQSESEAAFDEAVAALRQHLKREHTDQTMQVSLRDLSKLANAEVELSAAVAGLKPALVITLGSQATAWAQNSIQNIPLLFGMVLDPQAQGIAPERARSAMTGVSMQIPLADQFERLRQVLPDVKKVGTVYDMRNGALVDEARREAARHGLTLIGSPVRTPAEVPEAFRGLSGRVEALWSFPDTTVYSREAAQFILLFSFRNRLPLMGFSRGYVRAGALFALYADYKDVGRQLAEVSHEILSGRSPREIPIGPPRRHALALNMRVAEALGMKIPASAVASAEETFR